MASFGEGLGAVIGGALADDHLAEGISNVGRTAGNFDAATAPYNAFGQSFLSPASSSIGKINDVAGTVKGYEDFAKDYSQTAGNKYLIQQAEEGQNNSAAAKGKLLSGGNLRALTGIRENMSNTFLNQAYGQYLAGNNQQFGQLEQALGNMFSAIGVGTTATGQQAGVASSQMAQQAAIAQAQAKNDQSKGSGFGSIFSGLGSLATVF